MEIGWTNGFTKKEDRNEVFYRDQRTGTRIYRQKDGAFLKLRAFLSSSLRVSSNDKWGAQCAVRNVQ